MYKGETCGPYYKQLLQQPSIHKQLAQQSQHTNYAVYYIFLLTQTCRYHPSQQLHK